jgi:hypothetical protein
MMAIFGFLAILFFTLIGVEMTYDSMGGPSTSLSPSTSSI